METPVLSSADLRLRRAQQCVEIHVPRRQRPVLRVVQILVTSPTKLSAAAETQLKRRVPGVVVSPLDRPVGVLTAEERHERVVVSRVAQVDGHLFDGAEPGEPQPDVRFGGAVRYVTHVYDLPVVDVLNSRLRRQSSAAFRHAIHAIVITVTVWPKIGPNF